MGQAQDVYTQELAPPIRDPGSFRDPSGFVCHLDGQVFRAIDAPCSSLIKQLDSTGLLDKLQRIGGVIPTRVVRRDEDVYATLRAFVPQVEEFLQHERIELISYPYEWSTAMLADAGICCLDLQLLLVEHAYSLKDASAYNIQFLRGRPVFIDVVSIEKVSRRNVWTALDQFNRMFLFPLLLQRYHGCSLKEYFLASLDGAELDEVYRRFGFVSAMRPSLWMDVWLPHQLQRLAKQDTSKLRSKVEQDRSDPRPLVMNLKRVRHKVQTLGARASSSGPWLGYAENNSYDKLADARKEAFVVETLRAHPARRVLDIGCNTGRFAQLAEQQGAAVVAIDTDRACIDAFHRRTRGDDRDILPLVVDIANPSPGIGYRNIERASFIDRASFDYVFALALVHHLLITARLPMESIRDLLADLTQSHLIVEFVNPADEMFVSLLGAREDIYSHLSLRGFLAVFGERFELIAQTPITEHRTLVSFKKRS